MLVSARALSWSCSSPRVLSCSCTCRALTYFVAANSSGTASLCRLTAVKTTNYFVAGTASLLCLLLLLLLLLLLTGNVVHRPQACAVLHCCACPYCMRYGNIPCYALCSIMMYCCTGWCLRGVRRRRRFKNKACTVNVPRSVTVLYCAIRHSIRSHFFCIGAILWKSVLYTSIVPCYVL